MSRRATSFTRVVAINVLALAALLIVIEGAASWFLVARDVVALPWFAEPYTRYDPDLGWVGKTNARLENAFGVGVWAQTNSRGFRAVSDVTPAVAPGRYRVLCSGDSFTFGDGVDNDHTWCQQLATRDARIEPVNLGESGYGADQAYLRFLRDARDLQHQVHVFAFIADDFVRMGAPIFNGVGKPVLVIERTGLVARNVPVPRSAPWAGERFAGHSPIVRALGDTRTAQLGARLLRKMQPALEEPPEGHAQRDERIRAISREMLANLKRVSETRSSRLVLLYLPDDPDDGPLNAWVRFLAATAQEFQIPLVSVRDEFRFHRDARQLFLQDGTAAGHYSNAGHALVADTLYTHLSAAMPAR